MEAAPIERDALARRYRHVRATTEALAAPLSAEDMLVQSMPDASPTKWHLAHTTWFFEEFVLARFDAGHAWRDERWRVLFNSYYEAAGPRHPRAARGMLSRPSLDEVLAWRSRVDERVLALLAMGDATVLATTLLGTHHEEQHQELLLTDIKHALAQNPLRGAYASGAPSRAPAPGSIAWKGFEERIALIGHDGRGFAFDNEGPRHRVLVGPFSLASRLVTNGEYADFIADRGYGRPELWLAEGWARAQEERWTAPLYWQRDPRHAWTVFTLRGEEPLDRAAPVAHVSFYEADAYARWAGARLATEAEWEVAVVSESKSRPSAPPGVRPAADLEKEGNFLDSGALAPVAARDDDGGSAAIKQLYGDTWEWTASAYLPYPKFRPESGALGEYNGKFMSGQMVLRGGSCFSPRAHLRATYRNFFPPHARWQMTGIRLASDT